MSAASQPKTVVIFDCESDSRPRARLGDNNSRSEQDFRFVQCTCVCALIVPVAQLPSIEGAVSLTCWRDGPADFSHSPFEPLLEAFDAASIIVAFNALEFDFPLLWKHYGRRESRRYLEHRIKCLDMFSRLRAVSNHWPKLDDLLVANGLAPKTSDGREAIRMWEANERGALEDYCKADVMRTTELSLLPEMAYGQALMPSHVYGLMPALRAVEGGAALEEDEYVVV